LELIYVLMDWRFTLPLSADSPYFLIKTFSLLLLFLSRTGYYFDKLLFFLPLLARVTGLRLVLFLSSWGMLCYLVEIELGLRRFLSVFGCNLTIDFVFTIFLPELCLATGYFLTSFFKSSDCRWVLLATFPFSWVCTFTELKFSLFLFALVNSLLFDTEWFLFLLDMVFFLDLLMVVLFWILVVSFMDSYYRRAEGGGNLTLESVFACILNKLLN